MARATSSARTPTRTGASGERLAKVSTWHIKQTTQPEINGHVGDVLGLLLPPYLWA
jgi:hypothetical protein